MLTHFRYIQGGKILPTYPRFLDHVAWSIPFSWALVGEQLLDQSWAAMLKWTGANENSEHPWIIIFLSFSKCIEIQHMWYIIPVYKSFDLSSIPRHICTWKNAPLQERFYNKYIQSNRPRQHWSLGPIYMFSLGKLGLPILIWVLVIIVQGYQGEPKVGLAHKPHYTLHILQNRFICDYSQKRQFKVHFLWYFSGIDVTGSEHFKSGEAYMGSHW